MNAPTGTAPLLAQYEAAGLVGDAAMQFARRLGADQSASVQLAAALAIEAVLASNTCLDLRDPAAACRATTPGDVEPPPWPDPVRWRAELETSAVVGTPTAHDPLTPLILDGDFVFLRRFLLDEQTVADDLLRRATAGRDASTPATDLDDLFPADDDGVASGGRVAARLALDGRLVILTGGPGTGKTYTVARIIAALWRVDPKLDVRLAAPTGKAAARMTEAVKQAAGDLGRLQQQLKDLTATTIHSLLGLRPGQAPRWHADQPLNTDVVIIDEASMVSLPLMAELLAAVPPDARLILVGDPYQLASVEAGSVLGDLVSPASQLRPNVAELTVNHRSTPELSELFTAVNASRDDAVIELFRSAGDDSPIHWIDPGNDALGATTDLVDHIVVRSAAAVVDAAERGEADEALDLLGRVKVLCTTRMGDLGVWKWTRRIEAEVGGGRRIEWYPGRPVMVTRNDYVNALLNGDAGVLVNDEVFFGDGRSFARNQLSDIDTWWAMTIHKSQGSEFDHAIVCLDADSRLATRELLYTAITRARRRVTLVATEAALRHAVRTPATRTSGLAARLASAPTAR